MGIHPMLLADGMWHWGKDLRKGNPFVDQQRFPCHSVTKRGEAPDGSTLLTSLERSRRTARGHNPVRRSESPVRNKHDPRRHPSEGGRCCHGSPLGVNPRPLPDARAESHRRGIGWGARMKPRPGTSASKDRPHRRSFPLEAWVTVDDDSVEAVQEASMQRWARGLRHTDPPCRCESPGCVMVCRVCSRLTTSWSSRPGAMPDPSGSDAGRPPANAGLPRPDPRPSQLTRERERSPTPSTRSSRGRATVRMKTPRRATEEHVDEMASPVQ
jgi:hypothetical protein